MNMMGTPREFRWQELAQDRSTRDKVLENFAAKGYQTAWFGSAAEAAAYLDAGIDGELVGFGDSHTLETLDLWHLLSRHNTVIDPVHPAPGQDFYTTARQTLQTDIFFTSVNAATLGGELVNIDAVGNRVAGALYGHRKVYFVLGANKFCPDLESAVWRARNVAGPKNAQAKGYKTPCAVRGDKCYDCGSPQRICRSLVVHFRRMKAVEAEVVIIGEALGF